MSKKNENGYLTPTQVFLRAIKETNNYFYFLNLAKEKNNKLRNDPFHRSDYFRFIPLHDKDFIWKTMRNHCVSLSEVFMFFFSGYMHSWDYRYVDYVRRVKQCRKWVRENVKSGYLKRASCGPTKILFEWKNK